LAKSFSQQFQREAFYKPSTNWSERDQNNPANCKTDFPIRFAAGISVAIIAVVNGLGTQLNNTFTSISTQLK
jgi:hypothetical protein